MTTGSVVTPGPESFPVRMLGFRATVSPSFTMSVIPPSRSTAFLTISRTSTGLGDFSPFTIDTFGMILNAFESPDSSG